MTHAQSGPREQFTNVVITIGQPQVGDGFYPISLEIPGWRVFPPFRLAFDLPAFQALLGHPVEYGRALGRSLFASTALGQAYAETLAVTQGRGVGLRLRLLIEAPDLQGMPWERLFHEMDGEWLPLGTTAVTPFSRFIPSQQWSRPQPVNRRPLRVLAVIASPTDLDRARLDPIPQTERRALHDTLEGLPGLQVTYLESGTPTPPTLNKIRAALAGEFDFVHFLCHGVHRKAGTALFLEKEQGLLDVVTTERLIGAFKSVQLPPAFVFLTACESAARASSDGFLPLGPALVEDGGVQAVVAMTGRVGFDLARNFTGQFYTRLLAHGLVDLAVNESRALVRDEWDWGIPVLFSRLEDNRLLDVPTSPEETGLSTAQMIERCQAATQKERTVVGSKYIPDLYMPPVEIETNFRQFMEHTAACFLIVAKAGRGKTSLLCHLCDTYQVERPVLFLSGRYQEPEGEQDILRYLARRLDYPEEKWQACLDDLGRAAASGAAPLILMDGINESPAKPAKMLAALRELLFESSQRGIKVCITCRTDFWQFFRADFWRDYVWQEDRPERDVVRGKDIALFAEEIYAQVLEKYFRYFMIEGELIGEAWERCRNPLLLRFFCESFDGRTAGGRKVGPVAEIRLYPLFSRFWSQKLANVQERLGDQLAAEAVSDYILTIARLMKANHRTTISRREVAGALNTDLRAMLSPDSIYVRILDEEIIIEEETNPLTSSANVFFVYDKFSEFAISLDVYQSQGWELNKPAQIVANARDLMQEEDESEFATLRGALEFLVWQLEEQRSGAGIHFQVIDAMLDQDWKWRRIGVLLAFQLLHPEVDSFWKYLDRLACDPREFVRRICADQLPALSRVFPDRVIPLLFRYLEDSSHLVQQAARTALHSLDASAAIQAARHTLLSNLGEDEKQKLVSELLLFPYDSLSLSLQGRARWLVKENSDPGIQAIILQHFTQFSNTIVDLFELEELERLFQVDWTRDQQPANVYLNALHDELAPLREAWVAEIDYLERLMNTLTGMVGFLAGALELRPSQAAKNLDLPFENLVTAEDYPVLLSQINEHFGVLINLPEGSADQVNEILAEVTPAWLAPAIAGANAATGEKEQVTVDWSNPYAEPLLEVYQLVNRILARSALLAGQGRSSVSLHTPFGKDGLALEAGQLAQLFSELTGEYDIVLPANLRRCLTNPGRLVYWLLDAYAERQGQNQELTARTENLAAMDRQALRQRLADYEATSLSEEAQMSIEQDLQAMLHAFADSDLKLLGDVLEGAIQWHTDHDSQVLAQGFAGLFWRERGRIWSLASELLQRQDQRVVDFASQLMEQIEYSQEAGAFASVLDRVRAIVVEFLGVDPASIHPESNFQEDLEADSLDMVELVMSFEDEFGVEISDEDFTNLTTVGKVSQYLAERSTAP